MKEKPVTFEQFCKLYPSESTLSEEQKRADYQFYLNMHNDGI